MLKKTNIVNKSRDLNCMQWGHREVTKTPVEKHW